MGKPKPGNMCEVIVDRVDNISLHKHSKHC